ncbi:L-rhamnose mutarotase [Mucilaginibacter yixingensis]|uniref:L-rhamnose mutarotase n=1 Tax=Mucilaginibacter yixingensis TaxID=1295612 RepID=A0A2T5J950_9SPHI|nr:L-rhamnose mutarotase [Mucilaginibacter yixingensis]PTQ96586.1 L-rhamnose mutarotase [Mucilaginibacter yixingensis]
MKRQCYALDLKDDPELIAEYEHWHKAENGWPGVRKSIIDAGITDMQIFRTGNRLFMIMDTCDDYEAAKKAAMDASNPAVEEWEKLMWKFQQPLPWAGENEKWIPMKKIFQL